MLQLKSLENEKHDLMKKVSISLKIADRLSTRILHSYLKESKAENLHVLNHSRPVYGTGVVLTFSVIDSKFV